MEPVVNHVVVDVGEHETSADGAHDVLGQVELEWVHHNVEGDVTWDNGEDQVVLIVGERVMDSVQ